jgi:hypothetical protein
VSPTTSKLLISHHHNFFFSEPLFGCFCCRSNYELLWIGFFPAIGEKADFIFFKILIKIQFYLDEYYIVARLSVARQF